MAVRRTPFTASLAATESAKARPPARVALLLFMMMSVLLPACAVARSPQVVRVALLGPFEGRYREVGYNALYAARLALSEGSGPQPDLLPIDDGSALASAVARAEALALDPLVLAVVAVGFDATDPVTQAALGDLPVIIPGNWTPIRARTRVFLLGDPTLAEALTIPANMGVVEASDADAPLVGGDVLALAQFPLLRESLDGVTLLTNGRAPTADFSARYGGGDPFAPAPNALAMLTYDATRLAATSAMQAASAADPRAATADALATADVDGLSGRIAFADGVWRDAPRNAYQFDDDGALVAVEDLIEQR